MELRIPAAKLDEQARRFAVLCGERTLWQYLETWRRNTYRKTLMSFITGLGFEIVLTDSVEEQHSIDLAHAVQCQECYNRIPNGIRPHITANTSDAAKGSDDPQSTT